MGLEKTLQSPLDSKEIQQSILKEISPGCSLEMTDAEAETPILWPPDVKTDSLEKTLILGKIEGGRRRGRQGVDDRQASLVCCSPWGCRV